MAPKQNLTRQERTALKGLQKEKSITILPADKEKATVTMETKEYQEKIEEILNDEATYEKLKKYKAELIRMVNSLEKEGKITKDQYWYLYPTLEKVPRMYGSPKIHKEGVPLRPIVDYTQTIAYRVSRELANILQPLVGKTEHHTENSQELVNEMTKLRVEGESFVSYDVVSLFTKTPIKIITKRLENDKTLQKRTNLNVDDIIELLKFVLETTYFRYEGEIYQQKFGVAMGSLVSPIVVNLYMEDLEQKIIATAPVDCQPRNWKRYADDVICLVHTGKAKKLQHMNTVDPTGCIILMREDEENNSMPFLDAKFTKKEDGSVKSTVSRKKTHTDQYLNFASHHPKHKKLGVVRTLMNRCETITSEEGDKKEEVEHLRGSLRVCGYPSWALNKVTDSSKKKKNNNKTNDRNYRSQVVIPYVEGVSERIHRVLKKYGVATAMRLYTIHRCLLVHPKDKVELQEQGELVYQIPCKNCGAEYIGETGRLLKTRLEEHRKDVDNKKKEKYTRSGKKRLMSTINKSALTDN